MNGISLFTGYGGIDIALSGYVKPLVYCEIERYAQAIILSRMDDGSLEFAPIWNDVTTLNGTLFKGLVDIIYGGFPCQDISVAGKGVGLEGKRSGLFFEIIRLCKETSPKFIFLENVPAIRTRGAIEVQEALASIGYASRWHHLSAAEVGANHKRERWFLLAYADSSELRIESGRFSGKDWKDSSLTGNDGQQELMAHTLLSRLGGQRKPLRIQSEFSGTNGSSEELSDSMFKGLEGAELGLSERNGFTRSDWWSVEPDVGRVANGVKHRAHRIKALGNGVVPLQVRKAFEALIGIEAQ